VVEALILSRLLQFVAVIMVFGCGAFRVYGLGVDTATSSAEILTIFDDWFWRVAIVGTVVALLSALSLLLATTANMAGSAAAVLDPDTLSKVLFGTSFGRVWCWRLGFALLLIGVCVVRRVSWRMPAILILSLLLLVSLGWVGHAAEGGGTARLVHQINQMVHLLGAGLWLGGLVAWFRWLGSSHAPDPRPGRLGFRLYATWCLASRRWDTPQWHCSQRPVRSTPCGWSAAPEPWLAHPTAGCWV
jgi:putative copper resistance protein D